MLNTISSLLNSPQFYKHDIYDDDYDDWHERLLIDIRIAGTNPIIGDTNL